MNPYRETVGRTSKRDLSACHGNPGSANRRPGEVLRRTNPRDSKAAAASLNRTPQRNGSRSALQGLCAAKLRPRRRRGCSRPPPYPRGRSRGCCRPSPLRRTDHPFRFIRRRVLLQNGVARRLHLVNQLEDEIELIEQAFDARSRLLRDRIAARLTGAVQLLAAISPQSLVSLDAERRQNAVDLVDDQSPLPGQILPFPVRAPRFLVGLARDRNHRTDPRFAP